MSKSSKLPYFNLFLILALLIFAIIAIVAARRGDVVVTNLAWIVQKGGTGSTGTMVTGGNNLYLNNSTSNLTLTVAPNPRNTVGKQIAISNNTKFDIRLHGGTGVSLSGSGTIKEAEYSIWVADQLNNFRRLQ